ncbi:hypothetical protein SAMN05443377_1303 [Propionibacterium cyclohexanicum]|uniref:Uncharacterized protein n=1 Tax=Propionibacterium cyclohexanicum TaxID=64702 RepID=A0A1H9TVR3_9ACTN|nr:hypothetical protein SAMN05443377_1303 [Propionibacterium cyclohexanicum]
MNLAELIDRNRSGWSYQRLEQECSRIERAGAASARAEPRRKCHSAPRSSARRGRGLVPRQVIRFLEPCHPVNLSVLGWAEETLACETDEPKGSRDPRQDQAGQEDQAQGEEE